MLPCRAKMVFSIWSVVRRSSLRELDLHSGFLMGYTSPHPSAIAMSPCLTRYTAPAQVTDTARGFSSSPRLNRGRKRTATSSHAGVQTQTQKEESSKLKMDNVLKEIQQYKEDSPNPNPKEYKPFDHWRHKLTAYQHEWNMEYGEPSVQVPNETLGEMMEEQRKKKEMKERQEMEKERARGIASCVSSTDSLRESVDERGRDDMHKDDEWCQTGQLSLGDSEDKGMRREGEEEEEVEGEEEDDEESNRPQVGIEFVDLHSSIPFSLARFAGKVLLVVNTATRSVLAHQISELEILQQRYREKGLVVLALPSADFGMEHNQLDAVKEEMYVRRKVTYPVTRPVRVRAVADQHPFYKHLGNSYPDLIPETDFCKLLLGRDGGLRTVMPPTASPLSAPVIELVEKFLAEPSPTDEL